MRRTLPDGDQEIDSSKDPSEHTTDQSPVEFGSFGSAYSGEDEGVISSLLRRLRTGSSYEKGAVGLILGVIAICLLMFGATAFFATSWFPTGLEMAHYGPNDNLPSNANSDMSNVSSRPAVPTPTPVLGRPDSGFILSHAAGLGQGRLDVSNGLKEDAIVKLRSVESGQSYREIYIRAGENATTTEIAPGSYEIIFALGRNYAPSIKKFLDDVSFKKFDRPFDFRETSGANAAHNPAYKISLSKTPRGTTEPSITDEADFNR